MGLVIGFLYTGVIWTVDRVQWLGLLLVGNKEEAAKVRNGWDQL